MTKVIARIIIDSEDWEQALPTVDEHPVVLWKRVQTSRAHPFSDHELSFGTALLGDQYFV
jgi:hypothetical protein